MEANPDIKQTSLTFKQMLPYAGWALCIGLLIIATWRLYMIFERSPLFAIEQIEQQGCNRLSLESLCAHGGIGINQNLLSLASGEVSSRLETHPCIRNASVVKQFPDRLLIKLQEREPVAVINIRKAMYYLDEEGVLFHRLSVGDSLDFPVITGLEDYKGTFGSRGETREIRKCLSLLGTLKDNTILEKISEISVEPLNGLVFYLETLPVPIRIGWDNYLEKRKQLERIFPQLMADSNKITAIDLRFSGQVVLQQDIQGKNRLLAKEERTGARPSAISMASVW